MILLAFYFLKESGKLNVVISTHLDVSLCVGSRKDLDKLYQDVHRKYKITMLGQLNKHLGVHYDGRSDKLGETYLVVSMSKNTEEIIKYYEHVSGKG